MIYVCILARQWVIKCKRVEVLQVRRNTYRYISIHKTRCPTTGVSRAKVWHIKRVNTSFVWTTTLEEIEKGATLKKEKKNLISLQLVPVVLQSLTPGEGGGENAVCQLTGAQIEMHNQLLKFCTVEFCWVLAQTASPNPKDTRHSFVKQQL